MLSKPLNETKTLNMRRHKYFVAYNAFSSLHRLFNRIYDVPDGMDIAVDIIDLALEKPTHTVRLTIGYLAKSNHCSRPTVKKVLTILEKYCFIVTNHKYITISPIFGYFNFKSYMMTTKKLYRETRMKNKTVTVGNLKKQIKVYKQKSEKCLKKNDFIDSEKYSQACIADLRHLKIVEDKDF